MNLGGIKGKRREERGICVKKKRKTSTSLFVHSTFIFICCLYCKRRNKGGEKEKEGGKGEVKGTGRNVMITVTLIAFHQGKKGRERGS